MEWSLTIDKAMPRPLRVILRGVGQVFFCCNAVTGLIFLVALFIGGVTAGAAATVGVISSTVTAYLLGFSEDDIDAGLYGFNGTLVGPCLFLFLENSPQLWLYVVLASALSSIVLAALMRILGPYKIPASTSPFVLTSWMFLVAVYAFDSFSRGSVLPPPGTPAAVTDAMAIPAEMWFTALTKGVAEVMFADSVIVGILFLTGIAIVSLRGALMAVGGTIIGVAFPILLGANQGMIEMGLYSFNPVLTMMAVGWVFLKPDGKSAALAVLAGFLTVICQAGLANFLAPIGLPTLTFPFVLVMWMFLFAAGKSKYWAEADA
ncbi:urea transporter [Nitrosospira sp. Nsp13]|uniref:urea transporter n=1 Tax=Nitrosospira sp. Nsp13 TaxID=1855332 RepID=UPI000889061E|nr:urea transporter [Nitrosospira sp. Nsp13]SCY62451.1 urea transporter [Nitrosospira sp. Nsp13]